MQKKKIVLEPRTRAFGFYRRKSISVLAERLVVSREGFQSWSNVARSDVMALRSWAGSPSAWNYGGVEFMFRPKNWLFWSRNFSQRLLLCECSFDFLLLLARFGFRNIFMGLVSYDFVL